MNYKEILEKLESKRKDSINFQKKYTVRKMNELVKYYEGAEWALTYCIDLLDEKRV